MEHSEVRRLLSPYLDGELEDSEMRAVKEHLGGCAECTAQLEALRTLEQSVRMTRPPIPSEGYFEFFPSKLRARMDSERGGVRSIRRMEIRLARVRVGATALVVLMAFGIGVIYGQRGIPLKRPRFMPIRLHPDVALEQPVGLAEPARMKDENLETEADLLSRTVSEEAPAARTDRLLPPSEFGEEKSAERLKKAEPAPATALPAVDLEDRVRSDNAYGASTEEPAPLKREEAEEGAIHIRGGRGDEVLYTETSGMTEKGAPADPEEAYAVANLAQLQQDYDKALDGYTSVVQSSPGTELAAGAQFQINLMKASVDTGDTTDALRESARMWEEYIGSYPKSDLVASACGFYTHALYSIARKTQAKPDVEDAIRAIEDCSARLKDKSPRGFREKLEELKIYLDG